VRDLQLLCADSAKPRKLEQHRPTEMHGKELAPFPWATSRELLQRPEHLEEKASIELSGNALRTTPALTMSIAGPRSEIAAVARQEGNLLQGNAALLEPVRNRSE